MRTSITLAARPQGKPTLDNFASVTEGIPTPGAGEFLVRVIWLSLDPYKRGRMDAAKSYADPVEVGGVMTAGAVGEVMDSHHPKFPKGSIVVGPFGWTSHAVSDGTGVMTVDPEIAPISTALGVLGMPGFTAWTGINTILQAKADETVVVSAATGAVGSLAGQLAKAKGCRVIGVAGGPEKCAFAEEELGYDICLDHRAYADGAALGQAIKKAAPDGVDCYFENVGGKTLEGVVSRMNTHGRIALCGMIAWYSGQGLDDAMILPAMWRNILTRRLKVQGFIIFDHYDKIGAFLREVGPMIGSGQIRYRETVAQGLEAAPQAFLDMLGGGNFGKQLVRVGPDP